MRKECGIATARFAAMLSHKDAIDCLRFAHQATPFVIALDGLGSTGREPGAGGGGGFDARRARAQVPASVHILRCAAGVEAAYVGTLARITHKERDAVADHVLID